MEFLIQTMPPTLSSGITRRSANTHMQYKKKMNIFEEEVS
jgi:hypothetical protein